MILPGVPVSPFRSVPGACRRGGPPGGTGWYLGGAGARVARQLSHGHSFNASPPVRCRDEGRTRAGDLGESPGIIQLSRNPSATLLIPFQEYARTEIAHLWPSVGLAPALLPAGHPVRCFRAETSRCQAAPIADAPGHPAPPPVPRCEGLLPGRRLTAVSAHIRVGLAFLRRLDPLIVDLHGSRSPGRESNPQPAVYKTAALPLSHRSTLREKRGVPAHGRTTITVPKYPLQFPHLIVSENTGEFIHRLSVSEYPRGRAAFL